MNLVVAGLLLSGAQLGAVAPDAASRWADAGPLYLDVSFADGTSADLVAVIWSRSGNPLYSLQCHNHTYEDPTFNYSGDFECRLIEQPPSSNRYATLLADAESGTEWDTRGRFLAAELEGECGSYPEYGRIRSFRLRGMKLTLALRDVVLAPKPEGKSIAPRLKSFALTVEVKPDAGAEGEISALPRVRNPLRRTDRGAFKRDCGTVMVRDK